MTESNIQPDDYISFAGLRSILTGILRFFFSICRLVRDVVRRHYWLLTACAIFGGLAGWLYHAVSGKKYKVAMIVEYRTLDKTIYKNIVGDLNRMMQYGSKRQVAAQLGVPFSLLENVHYFGTTDIKGNPLGDEPGPAYPIFRITGELQSPVGADTLGEALIRYINGLPFLQSEVAAQMKIRQDQLSFIQQELANIDSLKKDNLLDPASIYRQSYSLDSLRASIRTVLIHGDKAVSPITQFRAADKPQSAPESFVILVLAAGGFLIALLISLFLELKTRVR